MCNGSNTDNAATDCRYAGYDDRASRRFIHGDRPNEYDFNRITTTTMSDDLENKLASIQQIAQTDEHIDATALMISALEQEHADQTETKNRRWAYLASLGLPPIGYGIAIYYRFFSGKKDAIRMAWWCIGLTTFSIIISIFTLRVILNAATQATGQQVNVQTLEQTPAELRAALQ